MVVDDFPSKIECLPARTKPGSEPQSPLAVPPAIQTPRGQHVSPTLPLDALSNLSEHQHRQHELLLRHLVEPTGDAAVGSWPLRSSDSTFVSRRISEPHLSSATLAPHRRREGRNGGQVRLEVTSPLSQQSLLEQRPMLGFRRTTSRSGPLLERPHHRRIEVSDNQLRHMLSVIARADFPGSPAGDHRPPCVPHPVGVAPAHRAEKRSVTSPMNTTSFTRSAWRTVR